MDDKKLDQDVRRGEKAKMVLNNELVKQYFRDKRDIIMHNLETSRWQRRREREELVRALRTLRDFEKEFMRYISEGENAKTKLGKYFKR